MWREGRCSAKPNRTGNTNTALEKSLRLLAAADLLRIVGKTLQYHVTSKTDEPALGPGGLMACCVSSFHLCKLPTLQPTITVTHELQTACMQAPLFRDMQNMPSACFPSHVLTQLLKTGMQQTVFLALVGHAEIKPYRMQLKQEAVQHKTFEARQRCMANCVRFMCYLGFVARTGRRPNPSQRDPTKASVPHSPQGRRAGKR